MKDYPVPGKEKYVEILSSPRGSICCLRAQNFWVLLPRWSLVCVSTESRRLAGQRIAYYRCDQRKE